MTRDSKLLWLLIGAAVLTFCATNFELLHQAFPGMTEQHEAWIRLGSMLTGVVGGVLRMSPLNISSDGRRDAIIRNAAQAETANVAANVAAVKADVAVQATSEAVDAAKVAEAVAVKAADPDK